MGCACDKYETEDQSEIPQIVEENTKSDGRVVVALFNYQPMYEGDLEFHKGDRLIVSPTTNWLMAEKLSSSEKGYIPYNYVTDDYDDFGQLITEDWWFEGDRLEAVDLLMDSSNSPGSFIVRNCSDRRSYVLSLLYYDKNTDKNRVAHYRIRKQVKHGQQTYSIHKSAVFNSLGELVQHYSVSRSGLLTRLLRPCARKVPKMPFRQVDLKVEDMMLKNRVCSINNIYSDMKQALVSHSPRKRSNVLLAIDASDEAIKAIEFYLESIRRPEYDLLLLHVIDLSFANKIHFSPNDLQEMMLEQETTSKVLEEECKKLLSNKGVNRVEFRTDKGLDPGQVIVSVADEINARMVVMGNKGQGSLLNKEYMGNVSQYVVNHANCPVVICRARNISRTSDMEDDNHYQLITRN